MQNLNFKVLMKHNNYHRPLIFNSVLWLLSFVILLFIFSKGKTPITADYIYTTSFIIVIAIPVSINFYILIPKLLKREKYVSYLFLFLVVLFTASTLKRTFFKDILDNIFPNYFFVSYLSNFNIYLTYTIFLLATTLFKLAEDWFYFNTHQNKLLKLKNQHIQTQLASLRSQINPHFLFNSLNVIYAMALEKKDTITSAILELSDVLRYVIYDSDTERVKLKDELNLIKNYIAFQKYRGHSENSVSLKINIENEDYKIYPMLLLPLLENSYKYGFSGSNTSEEILIELKQSGSKFNFRIHNLKLNPNQNLDSKYSGVGLENLKSNLSLVYPKSHSFTIHETKTSFTVTIALNNE